jgi:hypothetical protein
MATKNLVDNSSTTVTVNTPGVTINLVNRATIRQAASTGVPVVMWVYLAACTTSDTGVVELKDSTGTALITVDCDRNGAGWVYATGYLPATLAKYDAHYGENTLGTLTVQAFTLAEYTP